MASRLLHIGVLVLLGAAGLTEVTCQTNLIQNPGFEDDLLGTWSCLGKCDAVRVTDSYAGVYSAKVTNRSVIV